MSENLKQYIDGERKDATYEDMGKKYHLSAEQVREIAIKRATLNKSKDTELVTITENTQGKLEIVKLDVTKPQKVTIDDSIINTGLRNILRYNYNQIKKFKKETEAKFSQKDATIPKTGEPAFAAFKRIYDSDIYGPESIENIKELQKILDFTGTDIDGKFGPNTQKRLIERLSAPVPKDTTAPVPKDTTAPANNNTRPVTTVGAALID